MKGMIQQKYGNDIEFSYSLSLESFWKNVAKNLLDTEVPNHWEIRTPNGNATVNIAARGTFTVNDEVKPSPFVTMSYNGISGLKDAPMPRVFLSCVNPKNGKKGSCKGYSMTQLPDGRIDCVYGDLHDMATGNGRHVREPIEKELFWLKYYEKLAKGYADESKVYLGKSVTRGASAFARDASGLLYERLYSYSHNAVKSVCSDIVVTKEMAKKARQIWNKLGTYKTVKAFNRHLTELIRISPRLRNPMTDDVADFYAKDKSDFPRILQFEENLILAMEGLVRADKTSKNGRSFADFGIEVYLANDAQKKEVMDILGTSQLVSKVKAIYRIKPLVQEKKMQEYCRKHHITAKKKLWHGSRNENWGSILINSLQLNPNAAINGKMFGKGIYFAPSPSKSFGYTSYHGSYWAGGHSSTAFMGIFAVAYGNPLMVTSSGDYASQIRDGSYDCVCATAANTGLRNDEIVFYDEAAMCLNYLVEFGD